MAKFIVTYEGNETKKELHFRNEVFSYTMKPSPYGKTGDAKAFDSQLEEKFGSDDEEVLEAASLLDFGDDDEIEEALSILHEAESY